MILKQLHTISGRAAALRNRPRRFLFAMTAGSIIIACCPALARAQSAVDGFDPGANGIVYAVAVQTDGRIVVGGAFTMLGGGTGTTTRNRIGRLNADGSLDPNFDPGANGVIRAVAMQPDGKILVAGDFTMLGGSGTGTTPRNKIGRLNADGSLDPDFNPGANAFVHVLAVQPDGKILVGGFFTMLGGGGTGTTSRNYIGRLHADGSLDTSFNPGANAVVYAFAVLPGGKILVCGGFTTLGGGGLGVTTRQRIGRLNADSSLDASFNPGANDEVYTLALQADGKMVVGGLFSQLGGGGTGAMPRSGIGRLNADGSIDTSFDPGANGFVVALTVQPDGKILVGGNFMLLGGGGSGTTPRTRIGRLKPDGSVDVSFDPGANDYVYALPVQPDGKILVGGIFTTLTMPTQTRNRLGRLNADGTIDRTFIADANVTGAIFAVAVQTDQKILVGGSFFQLGGTPRNNIGRTKPDGTPFGGSGANTPVRILAALADGRILVGGAFSVLGGTSRSRLGRLNADDALTTEPAFNPGANADVHAMAVQADGKIVVGGFFTMLGGGGTGLNARNFLGRLHADGSLDGPFNPGANGIVVALAMQADGKILVGGDFTALGGGGAGTTVRNRIGRLNADGSLDAGFDPGANFAVQAIAVQPDGKILVVGDFTMLAGASRNNIGRLNADGSLDASFNAGANGPVFTLALQADGKILVGGEFTALSDDATGLNTRNGLGRFNPDGSLDATFNPGVNGLVLALAVQADGRILVGGSFTMLGGGGTGITARDHFGRLTNTSAAIQSLGVTGGGGVVTWSRSGAAPEVWRVTFESSTDGATYTPLGSGTRVAGGWQLSGLSLPAKQNVYIRARGFYTTGLRGGSSSIVESIALKTYQLFSDDALTAGSSLIRLVHITELRTRIDVLRVRFGLAAFAWTDASLAAGMTAAAVHVTELRTALQQAYTAAGQTAPAFTDSPLVPGSTSIKVVHTHQLRDAVIVLEGR